MTGQVATRTAVLSLIPIFGVIAAYYFQKWRKNRIPVSWEQIGVVKELNLYPLKSGRRIELQEAECTLKGLKQISDKLSLRDRAFMVYGEKDKEFRTARTYPKLVKVEVSAHDEDHVKFEAPLMEPLIVEMPKGARKGQEINLRYFSNEKVSGFDCGDKAANWISRYILEKDSGLRLSFNDQLNRDIVKYLPDFVKDYENLNNNSTGLYSDLAAIMIINEASVKDLNEKLKDKVSTNCFRPNIVAQGPQAYDEDKWEWIKIGDEVVLRFVKYCTRCVMTTIDPETGVRNPSRQPLKTLQSYRVIDQHDKAPAMGVYFEVKITGTVKIGDPIFVPKTV